MEFYDTHCHFEGTDSETDGMIRRAEAAGVTRVLAMGCDPSTNEGAIKAAFAASANVRLALGFDYTQAGKISPTEACAFLRAKRADPKMPALACIGEIGLDAHNKETGMEKQVELFQAQLRLADEWKLPVSIHTREADEATLQAIDAAPAKAREGLRGVIHCYTGDADFAWKLIERGFAISFSGIVTFRNADPLREVARAVPPDRLVIETDSPFLAPVPLRGKRNEPAFVAHVAECLAKVRETTVEEIAALTTRNGRTLFG